MTSASRWIDVKVDEPRLAQQIARALKAHHAFSAPRASSSTTGSIGDLVHAEITVQAAPWISVDRVTLYLNGNEAKRWAVAAGRASPFPDPATPSDGYVVVRVDGEKSLAPVVGRSRTVPRSPPRPSTSMATGDIARASSNGPSCAPSPALGAANVFFPPLFSGPRGRGPRVFFECGVAL